MRVFVSRLLEIERTKSSVPVRTGTRACTSVTIAAHNHESPPRMPPTHVAAPMHVSTRPRAQTDCLCVQGAHRRRQRRRDQRARGPRRAARKMQSDAHKSEKDAITRDRDIAICCASRGCKLAQESARLPTNAVRVTPANTRIPQSTTRTSLRTSGRQTKSG